MDVGTTRDEDPIAVYFDVIFFRFRSVPMAKESAEKSLHAKRLK